MQAVPLDFLSGELQPAQQNGLCELGAGSRKRVPMLHSNIPAQPPSLQSQEPLSRLFTKQGHLTSNKYKYSDLKVTYSLKNMSSNTDFTFNGNPC